MLGSDTGRALTWINYPGRQHPCQPAHSLPFQVLVAAPASTWRVLLQPVTKCSWSVVPG